MDGVHLPAQPPYIFISVWRETGGGVLICPFSFSLITTNQSKHLTGNIPAVFCWDGVCVCVWINKRKKNRRRNALDPVQLNLS